MFKLDKSLEVDLENYESDAKDHEYVEKLSQIEPSDAKHLLDVGVDVSENARIGTFIQKDKSVIHCKSKQDGVRSWAYPGLWKNTVGFPILCGKTYLRHRQVYTSGQRKTS